RPAAGPTAQPGRVAAHTIRWRCPGVHAPDRGSVRPDRRPPQGDGPWQSQDWSHRVASPNTLESLALAFVRLPVKQRAFASKNTTNFRVDDREIRVSGDQAILVDGEPAARIVACVLLQPGALPV